MATRLSSRPKTATRIRVGDPRKPADGGFLHPPQSAALHAQHPRRRHRYRFGGRGGLGSGRAYPNRHGRVRRRGRWVHRRVLVSARATTSCGAGRFCRSPTAKRRFAGPPPSMLSTRCSRSARRCVFTTKRWDSMRTASARCTSRSPGRRWRAGRFLTEEDMRRQTRAAVVGAEVWSEFARELGGGIGGSGDPVGERLLVDGVLFTIVGVLEAKERGVLSSGDPNQMLLIPVTTAQYRFAEGPASPLQLGFRARSLERKSSLPRSRSARRSGEPATCRTMPRTTSRSSRSTHS